MKRSKINSLREIVFAVLLVQLLVGLDVHTFFLFSTSILC